MFDETCFPFSKQSLHPSTSKENISNSSVFLPPIFSPEITLQTNLPATPSIFPSNSPISSPTTSVQPSSQLVYSPTTSETLPQSSSIDVLIVPISTVTNTHSMQTRTKNGIFKKVLIAKVSSSSEEPTSFT